MVGKKSGKALLREEGLARTDNNMDLTSWPQVNMINQKNYCAATSLTTTCAREYLKRDDQILALRLQNEEVTNRMTKRARDRDRALATQDGDMDMDDDAEQEENAGGLTGQDALGSKVVVIHLGSQNLRIGFGSDALPKTVPMVIARKSDENESEEDGGEPLPKRLKLDDGSELEPEKMFGEDFATHYGTMCNELKSHMRLNKRRVLPNSKDMVVNYNRRTPPETISEHNDPLRIDWTEIPANPSEAPEHISGKEALRIPDKSKPRYKLFWPIQYGQYNEQPYPRKNLLFNDIYLIIEDAIKSQLGLQRRKEWSQYGCVFVIPDLYDRTYVTETLDMLMRDFGFAKVSFFQESLAAAFGAGYTSTCIVDVGAQKTSICCVEEGMCIENSRVNLKYGGADVTETFIKMMLVDHFPYADINLKRRYDFLLADELKTKFCTMNEGDVSVQIYDFHLRASGQDTRKYTFKTYDEVLLAPMGIFQPSIFDSSSKMAGRRKLIERSHDLYDGSPNDPISSAQAEILNLIAPASTLPGASMNGDIAAALNGASFSTPRQSLNPLSRFQNADATPRSSAAGSPVPEGNETPQPGGGTPGGQLNDPFNSVSVVPVVDDHDDVLPVYPLAEAILASITHAARNDERKMRDFLGGIMAVGGGSQIPGFPAFLETRMQAIQTGYAKDIMIGTPPRELDPQVVVWKGASVFGKLRTNDSWIGQMEYDRLGSRLLAYKSQWAF